ncbi:MAG: hydrogenase nickel incorporation protein HypB [Tannerellaceae bacterium]|jgi:hydrogenase nickel incorporation protein HypB|nr:hydrogenase nickel incorporation protein HypB [Tannerellaceae bacterium]
MCDDYNHREGETVIVEEDILRHNNLLAGRNRDYFREKRIWALNMMSSPGSGKTSLLEETVRRLGGRFPVYVIEGDQQTSRDADRMEALSVPVVQVNTGEGCHLEAEMVDHAVRRLDPCEGALLFIENVGNLVCPALFDLGEAEKVVVVSVTEGDDKPLKYPYMFRQAGVFVINKTDLLPYLGRFDICALRDNILRVNPCARIFELSALRGEGLDEWCEWLTEGINISIHNN